jgi:hypothetical protein
MTVARRRKKMTGSNFRVKQEQRMRLKRSSVKANYRKSFSKIKTIMTVMHFASKMKKSVNVQDIGILT